MAKIIDSKIESSKIATKYKPLVIFLVGVSSGVMCFVLTFLFAKNLSLEVAGGVSTIITATFSTIALLITKNERPLLISIAVALTFWGSASLVESRSFIEGSMWTIIMYVLGYFLFSWIARYQKLSVVIILMTLVIVLSQLIVML